MEYLNKLKPDFAGFVFTKSKRQINKEQGKKLIDNLYKYIKTVGIFVDEPMEKLIEIVDYLKLDVIQLHGVEDEKYIEKLIKTIKQRERNIEVWKAIAIKNKEDIKKINQSKAHKVLLDHGKGGTGQCFKWSIASKESFNKPIILAGGLNSKNVQEGIKELKPWAVDVSSGVETEGVKDFNKIKTFIDICKA